MYRNYKKNNIKHNEPNDIIEKLARIDEIEYKGGDVLSGKFSSPDIENCIQKGGYHIFYTNNFEENKDKLRGEEINSVDLNIQLVKFIALLFQPGIITPTALERNMQIAYNAKANSGCISRQVGAVITDKNHSVKSIGWNDVAANQIPCNLRNLKDLVLDVNQEHFSDFEKGIEGNYDDGESFKSKATNELKSINLNNLNGKNCSFCFKTFHNVFEGMKHYSTQDYEDKSLFFNHIRSIELLEQKLKLKLESVGDKDSPPNNLRESSKIIALISTFHLTTEKSLDALLSTIDITSPLKNLPQEERAKKEKFTAVMRLLTELSIEDREPLSPDDLITVLNNLKSNPEKPTDVVEMSLTTKGIPLIDYIPKDVLASWSRTSSIPPRVASLKFGYEDLF